MWPLRHRFAGFGASSDLGRSKSDDLLGEDGLQAAMITVAFTSVVLPPPPGDRLQTNPWLRKRRQPASIRFAKVNKWHLFSVHFTATDLCLR
jgi:hypothetical protein